VAAYRYRQQWGGRCLRVSAARWSSRMQAVVSINAIAWSDECNFAYVTAQDKKQVCANSGAARL
ncbi:TPA: hypothetical protein ACXIEW_006129, partial [Pseudomonas aeruginosa]